MKDMRENRGKRKKKDFRILNKLLDNFCSMAAKKIIAKKTNLYSKFKKRRSQSHNDTPIV